ncbi:hypothetical protein N9I54_00165 [bacterium]|nr:hypothetical protein [bacterium]
MKKPQSFRSRITRRGVLKGAAVIGLSLKAGIRSGKVKASVLNPIQIENAKPGTTDWLLTNTLTDPEIVFENLTSGRSSTIEGYCSATSVRAGESLQIMVSANPASAFDLDIYRTGYYGGTGGAVGPQLSGTLEHTTTRPTHWREFSARMPMGAGGDVRYSPGLAEWCLPR